MIILTGDVQAEVEEGLALGFEERGVSGEVVVRLECILNACMSVNRKVGRTQ